MIEANAKKLIDKSRRAVILATVGIVVESTGPSSRVARTCQRSLWHVPWAYPALHLLS